MALVTAASDGVVCMWDLRMQAHALLKTLPCHDDSIWAMAVLPDSFSVSPCSSSSSCCVMTGSRNGSIYISNLATAQSYPVGQCPFPIRNVLPVYHSTAGSQVEGRIYIAGDCTSVHSLPLASSCCALDASICDAEGEARGVEQCECAACGEGGEGLGAMSLMSDRLRAICETTSGDIVLCSVLTGAILHRWAKVHNPLCLNCFL